MSEAAPPELERGGPEAARSNRPAVLAFAADAESEAVLRDALSAEQGEGVDVRRGDLDDAAKVLRRTISPHVLVIDISGNAQPITALAELSQLVEPDVRVLAIGDKEDISLYRGLTHGLGVLEYLFKPLTRDLVRQHFGPVIDRQPLGARLLRGGRIISVTGVHGGVGATTIAANLAWYLAERAHRPTLLLDGDLYGASAAMMLSVKSQRGLRVALESPSRVDELFIDRTAQVVGERLHVLSGEGKLAEVPPIAPGALTGLMDLLRRRYKFLVCDAPMPASRIGRELFDLAHQRILVTEPTLAGARDLLRYLAIPEPSLLAAPSGSGTTLVVLNQSGINGGIGLAQFEQATGRKPDIVIPYMKGALRTAANLGEPAAASVRPFTKAIQQLAFLAGTVADPTAGGTSRLSRWTRR
jgi:pilus assembly protein CpaE